MFYRKDLLKAAGVGVPKTWGQYLAAAKKLHGNGVSGNSMIAKSGDVSMFLVDWYTRFANSGGVLMSGTPQAKNFTPRLTSPAAVASLQHMVDCVQYADKGVSSYDFTASTDAFSAGKTAMMLMWSTIGGPVYNPKTSKVAGKVTVASPPGKGTAVRGGWGMGIPKNAKNKDAAWTVIAYLTSKEWDTYQTLKYQTDPFRNSTYFSPVPQQEVPVPVDCRQGVREGEDPRDREHPGDVRADHDRGAAVRGGAQRLDVGGRRPARRPTTNGSKSSSVVATSSSPAAPVP